MQADNRPNAHGQHHYPSISPHQTGMLEVGDGHRLYWEVSGNPDGKPALFLHGGPGGAVYPDHRRLFDPAVYRIVMFDQRGSGRSHPKGSLDHNTTAHLIGDIEKLREHLDLEDWLILGGSWGAALALRYAQTNPERVRALVLRGVFTARQSEVDWLYQFGASAVFPEEFAKFVEPIPEDERGDLVAAYHRRLTDSDLLAQREAARTWCSWESALLTMRARSSRAAAASAGELSLARIEAHYFVNGSFMEDGAIIADLPKIDHIPGFIVQGRYDLITPARTAHEVAAKWSGAELHVVHDAAHATSEPGILAKLVEGTNRFRAL